MSRNYLKSAFRYLNDCRQAVNVICKASGRSKTIEFTDLILSRIRYGAWVEDYIALEFYRKSHSERKKFLTSDKNWKTLYNAAVSPEAAMILNNKELFAEKFSSLMKREWIKADKTNFTEVTEFINRLGKVIAKPSEGCEGIGIFMIKAGDSQSIERLKNGLQDGRVFIIEQLIEQHADMLKLNAHSVNTIRMETMLDRTGKTHITNSIVIIGTGGDIINNTHNGGIMCHVDLSAGVIDSYARDPHGIKLLCHPDSNLILPGYKIPMWEEVKEFALQLSKIIPQARYVGWDIAITPSGPVVIEGNTRPGHCTQACDMIGRWPLIKSLI